ncbi:MAG: hypothetical protein O7G28_12365 [Deltaproteobacteria bacterium]|nr:hypothetical protein [Deltaproteobacteria bacterium]
MMSWVDFISMIKDILMALSALTVAGVAVWGLNSWRRELKGRADYDLARRILRSGYKVRDAIAYFRIRWIDASEFPDGGPTIERLESGQTNLLFVYSNRWNKLMEAVREFLVDGLEVEVLWGARAYEPIKKLHETIRIDLKSALERLLAATPRSTGEENFEKASERFHGEGNRSDYISQEIDKAIKSIEENAREFLRK